LRGFTTAGKTTLSTPHGALGTLFEKKIEEVSKEELSTPHGALGTVFSLSLLPVRAFCFQLHTVH